MAHHDFIMREIEGMTRFLANTLFQKQESVGAVLDENGVVSGAGYLRYMLFKMLSEGDINGAENLLHEYTADDPPRAYLPLALEFYRRLNELGDTALKSAGYERSEIADGLALLKREYGLEPTE